MREGWFDSC